MPTDNQYAEIPQPLRDILENYLHVEVLRPGWADALKRSLSHSPERAMLFRRQLAEAIVSHTIDPEEYGRLTKDQVYDDEGLEDWLREVWGEVFGDEPIPGDRAGQ